MARYREKLAAQDRRYLLVRRKSTPSLRRKRLELGSLTASSTTPSDQKPREEKSVPYQDPRYRTLLKTKGSYMDKSELDIIDANKNKARTLAIFSAKTLEVLVESVNEGWNNSIPLLRPHISFFIAIYYIYFPFLTCEVKCGAVALNIIDRQNAYSITLTVRAIVELFQLVKREQELYQQILAFSISYDHRSTTFYRHPIHTFDFTVLEDRIRFIINKLPSDFDFEVLLLPEEFGLSQDLESYYLSRLFIELESLPKKRRSYLGIVNTGDITPNTLFTRQGGSKKPRRSAVK
ncbi:hypothetical protein CC78DRAFT_556724 [Lojkania enalia]|uniref:DUF7924 domain-containing protein n=1 Tax=Lojkania enalia TaxID=147567 RepID=A0A9P4JYB2_9PLEO|nr:hypothetical protein CC78DRAFT_556724 [Didymosphaeria enalia]